MSLLWNEITQFVEFVKVSVFFFILFLRRGEVTGFGLIRFLSCICRYFIYVTFEASEQETMDYFSVFKFCCWCFVCGCDVWLVVLSAGHIMIWKLLFVMLHS